MVDMFKPKTTVTNSAQSNDPWGPAQGPLNTGLQSASWLYNNDVGYKPWSGQTQADMSNDTTNALNGIRWEAENRGQNLGTSAYNGATDFVRNGGITSGMQTQMDAMQRTANGGDMGVPPELQAMLDANRNSTADRVNAAASASGRFGSGMHSGAMGREITNATAPLLYQNFEQQQGRMDQARQGLLGAYTGAANNALGVGANAGAYQNALYDPYTRLAGVGGVYDDRSQNALQGTIDQYNTEQSRPWEQLGRLNAIATGAGQMGGTQVGTSAKPGQTLFQQLLGGGAATAGLLGKL